MQRLPLVLVASLTLAACAGTEVTNPDQTGSGGSWGGSGGSGGYGGTGGTGGAGGTGGTGGTGTGGGGVFPVPPALDFGATCPGGVARAWLPLENHEDRALLVELGAEDEIALTPAELAIEAFDAARVAAVHTAPADAAPGVREGTVFVAWDDGAAGVEIPWSAAVGEAFAGRSAILCGAEGPCEELAFAADAGQAIEVANDGCGPLAVTGFEATGGALELVGGALPVTLAPGERYGATLRLAAGAPAEGTLRILTDEAEGPAPLPFTVAPADVQSTR